MCVCVFRGRQGGRGKGKGERLIDFATIPKKYLGQEEAFICLFFLTVLQTNKAITIIRKEE